MRTGTDIEDAALWLGCQVEFHPGFRVELARVLGDDLIPTIIGQAARAGAHPPQHLKQVWHCLARFGR